ncbi:Hypothetical predicted protein, partial [Paramuricea clavata]
SICSSGETKFMFCIVDPELPCEQSPNTPASPLYGESLESEEFCFHGTAE